MVLTSGHLWWQLTQCVPRRTVSPHPAFWDSRVRAPRSRPHSVFAGVACPSHASRNGCLPSGRQSDHASAGTVQVAAEGRSGQAEPLDEPEMGPAVASIVSADITLRGWFHEVSRLMGGRSVATAGFPPEQMVQPYEVACKFVNKLPPIRSST